VTEEQDLAWYLIYTKPRQERDARDNLVRQGFNAWLPLVRVVKRRGTRRVPVVEPMFPRYLFVQLDSSRQDWSPIRSTLGVSTLVRFGGRPAKVPEPLVAALQARADEQDICDLSQRQQPTRGDRVRVAHGAFAGYEAVFQARNGQERVLVLLEVAGKQSRVSLPADDIDPVQGE